VGFRKWDLKIANNWNLRQKMREWRIEQGKLGLVGHMNAIPIKKVYGHVGV
jgi:hypothetical protein